MNDLELRRMNEKLAEAICNASDNGGVELLEAAAYSTNELARLLRKCGERESALHERRSSHEYAMPRGSRCQCPACAVDYRVMAALG